jgi:hypothetical protein
MNTAYITLSSNSSNFTTTLRELSVIDTTTLYVNLSNVSEVTLPLYLDIQWGDGKSVFEENDVFSDDSYENNFITLNRYTSFFYKIHNNTYYPSGTSLTKRLTAVCKMKYCNNNVSTFNIPILIRNGDYNSTIEDVYLVNTIYNSNKKIHQLLTKRDGYVIEVETPSD